MEHEGDDGKNCKLSKEAGNFRIQRTSKVQPDNNIIKKIQNIEKSPRDLTRLAVT